MTCSSTRQPHPKMTYRRESFTPDKLIKIGRLPPDDPPLRIGDYATLNSGGPAALVVDTDTDTVTLSWRDAGLAHEQAFPRAAVHRVTPEK